MKHIRPAVASRENWHVPELVPLSPGRLALSLAVVQRGRQSRKGH